MLRRVAGTLLLALTVVPAGAADVVPRATKKLDAYFDVLQQSGLVNGSIAISERGALRYQRSVGFATLDKGVASPADEATRYRIGAVSRLFTATLAMQMAESATITLDNTLAEFYPNLPNAAQITYRQMLQGRSGLSDYSKSPGFAATRTAPHTHAELLKRIADGGSEYPPGERAEVNDSNYLLLGYVLEKVRGKSFDDVLRQQITNKLPLVRTYFAGSGTAVTLESHSYIWANGWQRVPDEDPSAGGGAGGIVSNAVDLVTFLDAIFAGKAVTPYSLGTMREQGIAFRPLTAGGMACLGEQDHVAAYDAFVCRFPDSNVTLAWTGNATRVPVDQVLDETLGLIFDKARKPPKTVTAE